MARIFKKYSKNISILFILVCVILMTGLLFSLKRTIAEVKEVQTSTTEAIEQKNKKNFSMFVEKIKSEANTKVKYTASQIEIEIKRNYSNIFDLKKELDSDNYSNLSNIISPFISDSYLNDIKTDGNTMFVATSKGIICDYGYSFIKGMEDYNEPHTYNHWDNCIKNSYNKKLAKNAISSLINKDSGLILWQYTAPKTENDIDYADMNSDNISDYFVKYGVDIFKDIEILVPTYITDTGDVFGQKDIDQGVKYENYKLIVVQRINVYEQLKAKYPDLFNTKTMDDANKKYNNIMCSLYIVGIIVTIVAVVIFVQLWYNFNKYVIDSQKSGEVKKD